MMNTFMILFILRILREFLNFSKLLYKLTG